MTEHFPQLHPDRNCPTWSRPTWWERLLRRKPERVVYMLPDQTFVCSFETKAWYEAHP